MDNTIKKTPEIDVIIPVYNGEKFILDAINSVIFQTLEPVNVFVVNDGSTDNTEKIVNECRINTSIPIVHILKENGGPNSARNLGLSLSKAEFVAFLDADDIWDKEKLEKQFNIYKSTKYYNLGLVYCDANIINIGGKEDKKAYMPDIDRAMRGNVFEKLLSGNKIISSASGVLIKREVFGVVGIFDESLYFGEDWDMWLRIAEKYEIDFSDEILTHIRRHDKNQTNNLSKVFLGEIDFYNKWTERLKDKYQIPKRWADVIAFHIIRQFPNIRFIRKAKQKISSATRKMLFRKTFGSIYLYCLIFFIRKLFAIKEWKGLFKKMKK